MDKGFEERSFWNKVKNFALKAGREVIEKSLWLYYAAQEPGTPTWAKATIYGALAYFISPIDAIPDAVPVVGYSDDLGVLLAAIGTVSLYITAGVKDKAARKLATWFGEGVIEGEAEGVGEPTAQISHR